MKKNIAICVTAFLCVPAAYAMKGDCGNSVMKPKLKKTNVLCVGCGTRNYSASTTSMSNLAREVSLPGCDEEKDKSVFMLQCKNCKNEQCFVVDQCACAKGCSEHKFEWWQETLCSARGIPLDAMVSNRELFKLCRPAWSEKKIDEVFDKHQEQGNLLLDGLYGAVVQWRKENKEATACEENTFINEYCKETPDMSFFLLGFGDFFPKSFIGEMQPHFISALRRFCEHKRDGTLGMLRCSRYYVLFRQLVADLTQARDLSEECVDAAALTLALSKRGQDEMNESLKAIDTSMLGMEADSWTRRDSGLMATIESFGIEIDKEVFPVYQKWTREFAKNLLKKIKKGEHRDDLLKFVKDPDSRFGVCRKCIELGGDRKILQENVLMTIQARALQENMDAASLGSLRERLTKKLFSGDDDSIDIDNAAYFRSCCQGYVLLIASLREPGEVGV